MLVDNCTTTTLTDPQSPSPRDSHPQCLKDGLMSISAYSMQGRRSHMEDFFDIAYQMKPATDQQHDNAWPYEYFYFGIFDGHGGHEAAKFAKANLLKYITKQSCFWSNDDEDVMRAIRQGYAETHSAMKKLMPRWSRTNRILPSTAGTTASVLFIKNGKFYTGHVGDTRIVISNEHPETKQWISHQLTEDHKPESALETERIERAGGEVRCKIGVHRVVWRRPVLSKDADAKLFELPITPSELDTLLSQVNTYPVAEAIVGSYQTIPFLAIARSLGDFWSINPYSGQYIVSPEPDIACRPISPNDKCILLATDGLWNVMNSSQATRALQELKIVKKGQRHTEPYRDQYFTTDNFYDVSSTNRKNHALSLVYMAYQIWERRRLRSDNITAVVAMIGDILNPINMAHQTPKKSYTTRASNKLQQQHQIEILNSSAPLKVEPLESNPTQIEQTSIYCEKIRTYRRPHLKPAPYDRDLNEFLQKLENYLVLPPTVLEQELMFEYGLIEPPKNYLRLSYATLKKLRRADYWGDSYIYIKRASDDPADRKYTEARTNKAGKRVRDASSQATQAIHDFGQPWDQLKSFNLSDDECKEFEEDVELVHDWEVREDDILVDDEMDVGEEDDDDEEYLFFGSEEPDTFDEKEEEEEEEDDDGDEEAEDDYSDGEDGSLVMEDDINADDDHLDKNVCSRLSMEHDDEVDCAGEQVKKLDLIKEDHNDLSDSPSIPQLRCLMNCNVGETPKLRRSTRSGTYQSVTENSKRKNQTTVNLSKSNKRRKSHPVPCALTQA